MKKTGFLEALPMCSVTLQVLNYTDRQVWVTTRLKLFST